METVSCGNVLLFLVSCVLSNNFIFSRFLGCCPFLGVSSKVETAAGMGIAVTFVMALASLFTWMVYNWILVPLNLAYLDTISFILVIAALVQFVEMFIKKSSPSLYKALGIYLPLITTNCAVLGVTMLDIDNWDPAMSFGASYGNALLYSLGAGLGFTLAMILFAGVRSRLDSDKTPKCFQGMPITLIAAAIVSVAFMGFGGVVDGLFQ